MCTICKFSVLCSSNAFVLYFIGPRYVVQIGDKAIDYNEDFYLFLTTHNPLPDITPDAASIISEVNFTTTKAGLTAQVRTYVYKVY